MSSVSQRSRPTCDNAFRNTMTTPAHGIRLLVSESDPDTPALAGALLRGRGDSQYSVHPTVVPAGGRAALVEIMTNAVASGAAA